MNLNPNYTYKAKIINVVDGDTVDAVIDLGFHIKTTQRLRLLGVDAPELRGPKAKPESAQAAKIYVMDKLMAKEVNVRTLKSDSFGRWLALIEVDGIDFNAQLIYDGHAKEWVK
jgi:micrococcal nuclease